MPTKTQERKTISFLNFFPLNVETFISDGHTDFSFVPGANGLTREQEKVLQEESGLQVKNLVNIKQVHGNRVIVLDGKNPTFQKLEEADGIVTNIPNLPIAVRTADCLSILLCDPVHQCIGVVHAGWKSTKAEIVPAAVSLMHKTWGTNPKDIKAAFGPAIRECCYEVGEEFKTYFPKETFKIRSQWYFNNAEANYRQLEEIGVLSANILDCAVCTHCTPGFHSHRRDAQKAGRMISIIMMKE